MCKGKPLCDNLNDLKWCKDVWDLSSPNFKHIQEKSKHKSVCNKAHQPENFVPNGQVIYSADIGNGLVYNCFNRVDEDPFKKVANNQSEDEVDKSWSDWVRTPCEYDMHRRCLGQKPSQCVFTGYWGYPEDDSAFNPNCNDNSDKAMNSTMSPDKPCNGNNYFWHGRYYEAPTSWIWFHCRNTQKCIHIDSRCDLHPNPHCIYEKDGIMVAEDEEDCIDEYVRKGLVAKTANFICSSPDHNTMSPAVISTTFTTPNTYNYNVTVIPSGTTVQIQSVKCDGIFNCWDGLDEKLFCGFTSFQTVGIGKQFKHFLW